MEKFIQENKVMLVIAAVVLGVLVIFSVMGGGASGNVSGNAKLDQSKAVTTSQDQVTNGAVKMGNIGSVGGNLDLSRHNTKNEGNE